VIGGVTAMPSNLIEISDDLTNARHLVEAAYMASRESRDVEAANERDALQALLSVALDKLEEVIAGLEEHRESMGAIRKGKSAKA
jgi:hypothetical protein